MKSRKMTTNGFSFTDKQLSVIRTIQNDEYITQYLVKWLFGLPITKKAIKDEIMSIQEKYDTEFDILFIYTMNKVFGFGKKRLMRIYKMMIAFREEFEEFYKGDKQNSITENCDIDAMKNELKLKDLTPEIIFAGVKKEDIND